MNNKADILNELKGISLLLSMLKEKDTSPEIPAGYFESLSDAALQKIALFEELKTISPLVANVCLEDPKPQVPAGYFTELPSAILNKLEVDKEDRLSFEKEEMQIPQGYFDSFADHLLAKIKEEERLVESGKIIPLAPPKRLITIRMFSRIAVAASLLGVMVIGVLNYQKTTTPANNCEDGIACLTQDEIYNYMSVHSNEFNEQQIREVVRPALEGSMNKLDIDKKEAVRYIEQHKNVLDVEDASTDIF